MPNRRPSFAVGVVVLAVALLAGCNGPQTPAWRVVTPPGMTPSALFVGANAVFVGGQAAAPDAAPVLDRQDGDGWREVPATAATGYGQVATFVEGAANPAGRIVMMGTATGGAHLNPRWTTWIGDDAGIVEQPQTSETFGGPNAGGITGVTYGAEPAIVGSWSLDAGATGVAVWRRQASTWAREPSPPVFVGSPPTTIESATAATAVGSTTVIVGLQTDLAGGAVHQRAELWRSDGGAWSRTDMDTSGADSAATDVTCTDTDCLVVGRSDGDLAVWRVSDDHDVARIDVPTRSVDHYTGAPRVARDSALTAIAVGAGAELLTSTDGRSWTDSPTPVGEVRGLAVRDGAILLLLRDSAGAQQVYQR